MKIVIQKIIYTLILRYDAFIFGSSPSDRHVLLGISQLGEISRAQLDGQDSELLQHATRNLSKMFDEKSAQILPPVELLLRWNHLLNNHFVGLRFFRISVPGWCGPPECRNYELAPSHDFSCLRDFEDEFQSMFDRRTI